jgi:N6-adenosine-specific RNA methylase IME4
MNLEEIKKMSIPTEDNAILLLWATAPKLEEAISVLNAWGFSYRTCAVWDKEKIGMGYWFRGQHELLLVGTKGKFPAPLAENRVSSVYREKRTEHSKKPDFYYTLIEAMFPNGKYLELFARKKYNKKWQVFGNQIE